MKTYGSDFDEMMFHMLGKVEYNDLSHTSYSYDAFAEECQRY